MNVSACVGVMVLTVFGMEGAPLQTLANHVPQAVRQSRKVGPVTETAPLNLAIGLPLRNAAELDAFIEQVADPTSVNYRQYLSVDEFSQRFGPSQHDYDKLVAFAEANGLTVSATHPNRMVLDVTGPVGAVNKALHINLTVWEHPTRGQFFAPDRAPSLNLDVRVQTVSGLDNFTVPRPMDLKLMPKTTAPLVSGSGPSGLFIGKDFRAAYAPGVTLTGAGQKIGLVEFDGFYAADVTANFKQAGMTAPAVSTVLLDGFNGAPGSSNIEVILDIAMAGYMAPGASVIVYEGYYPNDVLNRMATDNSAKNLSCSWGYGIDSTTEQIFKQMIAQGQSFFTASGDSGAYSGSIMPPADDPNVISVGGTALTTAGGAWQSESAWSGSGGGMSTTYAIPSYQQGTNMAAAGGSSTMRNMPDVALTGAVQMYLIYNNGAQTAVGGTSAATPLWTAFTALANQQAAASGKASLGFINPTLYAIGNSASNAAGAFHDITTGNTGFAAKPGYDLTTGWGSPTGQTMINDLTSLPSTPSFTLAASPNPATVQAGSSTTSTVQVTAQNGFTGTVALSLTGLPAGMTGTFGAFNSTKASILTLTATSAAVAGKYAVSVTGVSGTVTSTAALSVVVTGAASFTLNGPSAVSVIQGATAMASVSVVPVSGFTGAVALTVAGLPTGVTAAFNPASTSTSSVLTFTASSTAPAATTNVTITGKSGSLNSSMSIALTVSAPASFTIAASAPTLTVAQASSESSIITVTPKSGFTGKVTLSASGLPSGVSVSLSAPSTSTTVVATFAATAAAPVGTSIVTITGTSGTASALTTIAVTVKAGASFTLTATPSNVSVSQGASGTSTITVTPVNGFTGTPSLAVTGLPAGVTAAFTGSVVKFTVASTAAVGASTVIVTGASGAVSAQTPIALTVTVAAGFKLSPSAVNISVVPGGTGTSVLTITPQGGFSSAVALSVSGLPAGVTAAFRPASTSTTTTLTLTATIGSAAKAYQFIVNGVSGTLTASVAMTATVTSPADFSIALTPASLRVVQGGKGSTAIALTPLNGFSGTVALSSSGLPAGVTAAFGASSAGVLGLLTVTSTAAVANSQVTITATSGALVHTAVLSLTVVAPTVNTATVDLSPSYNVPGIAADGVVFTNGGLDGGGRSYSGMLLGASQTVSGTVYAVGPTGMPDAVSAQTVALPAGQFSSLKMLATGVNGNQASQKFIVTYTDGTSTTFTQSLSDWFTPQNYSGETQAMTMNYRDNSIGTTDGEPFRLYAYSLALSSAKTVKSIALPQNRNVVVVAMTLAK